MPAIREATLADLPGIYRVCRLVADPDGAELAPDRNPDLPGHLAAGAYVVGRPALASVVVDAHGVAGYVLGSDDTRGFEAWCEQDWWPMLREQYPLETGTAADAELIGRLHRPVLARDDIVADFPAHLHIDLLPRIVGTGVGRRLMERLLGQLAARDITGVHVRVPTANTHAIGFAEHLGFTTLADDGEIRWMTRPVL